MGIGEFAIEAFGQRRTLRAVQQLQCDARGLIRRKAGELAGLSDVHEHIFAIEQVTARAVDAINRVSAGSQITTGLLHSHHQLVVQPGVQFVRQLATDDNAFTIVLNVPALHHVAGQFGYLPFLFWCHTHQFHGLAGFGVGHHTFEQDTRGGGLHLGFIRQSFQSLAYIVDAQIRREIHIVPLRHHLNMAAELLGGVTDHLLEEAVGKAVQKQVGSQTESRGRGGNQ